MAGKKKETRKKREREERRAKKKIREVNRSGQVPGMTANFGWITSIKSQGRRNQSQVEKSGPPKAATLYDV